MLERADVMLLTDPHSVTENMPSLSIIHDDYIDSVWTKTNLETNEKTKYTTTMPDSRKTNP